MKKNYKPFHLTKNKQNTGVFFNASDNSSGEPMNINLSNKNNFGENMIHDGAAIKINFSKNERNNNYENKILEEEFMENEK